MLKSWNKRHDVLTLYLLTTLLVPNFGPSHRTRLARFNVQHPPTATAWISPTATGACGIRI